jgi:type II secretory pathway pseudopilin PulG
MLLILNLVILIVDLALLAVLTFYVWPAMNRAWREAIALQNDARALLDDLERDARDRGRH